MVIGALFFVTIGLGLLVLDLFSAVSLTVESYFFSKFLFIRSGSVCIIVKKVSDWLMTNRLLNFQTAWCYSSRRTRIEYFGLKVSSASISSCLTREAGVKPRAKQAKK